MSKLVPRLGKNRKLLYALALIILWGVGYLVYFRYFGTLPQATAVLFPEMSAPQKSDVIVVFSPHEDDETLGVGGYIAQAETVGADVHVVFATDGNRRNKKAIRLKESLVATEVLGVSNSDVIYYDYPDMDLTNNAGALSKSIEKTLDDFHPNIVFVTSAEDIHPDHRELGKDVALAISRKNNIRLYSYLIHYRAYPRPQAYRPGDHLLPPVKLIKTDTIWYRFTLDTNSFDKKNEAVLKYKSQLSTPFLHSLMMSFIRQNEIFESSN